MAAILDVKLPVCSRVDVTYEDVLFKWSIKIFHTCSHMGSRGVSYLFSYFTKLLGISCSKSTAGYQQMLM